MVEQAQRSSIGAVGARLLTIKLCASGNFGGVGGIATYGHQHFPSNSAGYRTKLRPLTTIQPFLETAWMWRRELLSR
jgi:hypothetical protein